MSWARRNRCAADAKHSFSRYKNGRRLHLWLKSKTNKLCCGIAIVWAFFHLWHFLRSTAELAILFYRFGIPASPPPPTSLSHIPVASASIRISNARDKW